jgi:hypothetical protein
MTRAEYTAFGIFFLVGFFIPGHQTESLIGMVVLNGVAGASHAFNAWGR